MDWTTARRLGANQLKVFALSTMLTTVGVAAVAVPQADGSATGATSIRGVVRDGDQPISHLEVRAKPRGRGAATVTRTDEHGTYAFEAIKPGSYVISFGVEPADLSRNVDVEVCKGSTLVLDSNSPPSNVIGQVAVEVRPPGSISGRITSENQVDGLSGAIVRLLRPSDGLRKTTRTNAAGGYNFHGLDPGHYVLTGAAPGFLNRSKKLDLGAQSTEQVFAPGLPSENVGDIVLCPRRPAR
jgi:hypothetical protein